MHALRLFAKDRASRAQAIEAAHGWLPFAVACIARGCCPPIPRSTRWCAVPGKRAKPRGLLTAAGLSLAAGCVVVHRPCRSVPHLDGCALVLEVRARRGAPQSQRPESTTGSLLRIRRPLCSPGTAALTAVVHDELQCKHTESALNFIQCEQPPVRTDRTRLIQATLRDRGVQGAPVRPAQQQLLSHSDATSMCIKDHCCVAVRALF